MKEVNKRTIVRIRLNGFSCDIYAVKSIGFSIDGRMVEVVESDGTSHETAIQNVIITNEVMSDDE